MKTEVLIVFVVTKNKAKVTNNHIKTFFNDTLSKEQGIKAEQLNIAYR